MSERRPFTCSQCRRKVDTVYYAPCCGAEVCARCIILGHETEWALREYECKKCKRESAGREDGVR